MVDKKLHAEAKTRNIKEKKGIVAHASEKNALNDASILKTPKLVIYAKNIAKKILPKKVRLAIRNIRGSTLKEIIKKIIKKLKKREFKGIRRTFYIKPEISFSPLSADKSLCSIFASYSCVELLQIM